MRRKATELPRPGLRHFVFDLLVGVAVAWLVPDGINRMASFVGSSWTLGETSLSDVEVVLLTTFFLFVIQSIGWLHDVTAATTTGLYGQLERWAETSLPKTLSATLLNNMATHLLGREDRAPSYVRGLELYTSCFAKLPQEAQPVASLLLSKELQDWTDRCESLRTEGIDISQEEQVALIAEVCRSSSSFLLVDSVLYSDVSEEWTAAWRDLVSGELAASAIKLEYVYLMKEGDVEREVGTAQWKRRVDALAGYMTDHGWRFYICDERDVHNSGVPTGVHDRLLEVFDDTLMISMPATADFATGAPTRTRLSGVDDNHRRFIDAVVKYKQEHVR